MCFGYGLVQLSLEVGRRGGPNRGKGILLDVLSKVEIDLLAEPLITQSFSLGRHGKCHRYRILRFFRFENKIYARVFALVMAHIYLILHMTSFQINGPFESCRPPKFKLVSGRPVSRIF